jgi:hypothetical protein
MLSFSESTTPTIIGLSKRHDRRVLIPLIAMLEQPTLPDRALEAAEHE